MPKKLPYFQFYPGDYLKDPALTLCAAATRGIWMDLLCRMHEFDRSGELRGTADQLARLARCSTVEFVQAANDLRDTNTAEVVERNGAFTIRNRRMYEEAQLKKSNAERQLRYRNGESNGQKTPPSEYEYESQFEEFWKVFPAGRKKSKATAREAFIKAAKKCEPEKLIAAAKDYANSEAGRGAFVKMPATWLNQECWNDDREAWRDKDRTDGKPAAIEVQAEEFNEMFRSGKFTAKPIRHATDPKWWWAFLRDGTRVTCKNVPTREV